MRKDFLRDETGDVLFKAGDFATGQSDQQHVEDLLDFQPGELKEFPLAGFGAINYIKRTMNADEFKRDLKLQLSFDGYDDATIDTTKGIEKLVVEV